MDFVCLGSDRDTSANFSCNQTSTEYYEETHTYFYFGAIGINGSSGTVPAATISGMVGTYPTNWCLLKVEGIGDDPTANSAASGEGGLVWIKGRTADIATQDHRLIDTERGVNEAISSAANDNVFNITGQFTGFNSNGFSLADTTTNGLNRDGEKYVSWTFRNQPGFFEVIKYEGNGTAGRTVSHNLGSAPGCIIVKRVESGQSNGDFFVYHRGNTADPETDYILLNGRGATNDSTSAWNDTAPTATEFTLGTSSDVNASSNTYIAYLFAHDDQSFGEDSDEAIINEVRKLHRNRCRWK